ncbi:putative exostosin [Helianthus anomalus]
MKLIRMLSMVRIKQPPNHHHLHCSTSASPSSPRPHAQDFLTVIPIEGLGQRISAVEYRLILKYRLMIPMFPNDETCPVCRKACLAKYGEHAIHCRELLGFKYRHDFVRDALMDILRRAGILAKKEAPVNFLTDPLEGRSTLRPTDVLVFGWEQMRCTC